MLPTGWLTAKRLLRLGCADGVLMRVPVRRGFPGRSSHVNTSRGRLTSPGPPTRAPSGYDGPNPAPSRPAASARLPFPLAPAALDDYRVSHQCSGPLCPRQERYRSGAARRRPTALCLGDAGAAHAQTGMAACAPRALSGRAGQTGGRAVQAVALELRVKGAPIYAEQPGGALLVAPRLLQDAQDVVALDFAERLARRPR